MKTDLHKALKREMERQTGKIDRKSRAIELRKFFLIEMERQKNRV